MTTAHNMNNAKEKKALVRTLRENIVHLCKVNSIFGGQVDIDGIICISGQREGQEIVVKIHEKIGNGGGNRMKSMLFPDGFRDSYLQNRIDGEAESDLYDYSMQNRNNFNGSNGHIENADDTLSEYDLPSKRSKTEDQEVRDYESRDGSPIYMEEQAEDLSSTGAASNCDDIAPSPSGSSDSPTKSQYLGKAAYLSSPYHLQKKMPLKSERWTPTMPVPTMPECKQCNFSFENFDVLSEHNEAVHSVFTCNNCYKTFTSRSNLERHSRLHTGFKPYVCAICSKAFSRKDHLSNHAAKHAYKCATCNKRFADKKTLATHFTYDHDSVLSHVCDFCNKGFSSQELYEEHVKTHPQYHAVQKTFYQQSPVNTPSAPSPAPKKHICTQCSFSSSDRLSLLKHSLTHSDNQRCITCLSCAKTFNDPFQYEDHFSTHQGEQNIFECCLCRHIFQSYDILMHHQMTHLSEDHDQTPSSGFFPCSHCDKVLKDNSSFQEHMHMHRTSALMAANAPKFNCTFCNMQFNNFVELTNHIQELRHFMPGYQPPFMMPMHFATDLSMATRRMLDLREHQKEMRNQRPSTPEKSPIPNEEQKVENKSEEKPDNVSEEKGNADISKEETEKEMTHENKYHETNGDESENDIIGNDIIVVEPQAPEDDANDVCLKSNKSEYNVNSFKENESADNIAERNQENHSNGLENKDYDSIKSEPLRSLLGAKSSSLNNKVVPKENAERTNRRKGPSPEKFVNIPPPPPYMESPLGGYFRHMESFDCVQDLSMKTALNIASPHVAAAAAAAAAMAEEQFRVTHEKVRIDKLEKSLREREQQKTPQPPKQSIDIPAGPHTCSVCTTTFSSFHEMETHCFVEHNRSPCMFCSKTFAQKANRDRHVCLHTGDKPYACPDCDEKFSRGDKLKLHRIRVHNLQVSPLVNRNKEANSMDWTSVSSNQSDDAWIQSYKKDTDIVHAGGEWSMVNDSPNGTALND